MKQIKTICVDQSNEGVQAVFDKAVNEALAEGWTLTKRCILNPYESETFVYYRTLYAELEKEIITEDERSCSNCQYRDLAEYEPPCIACDPDGTGVDKWEPRT